MSLLNIYDKAPYFVQSILLNSYSAKLYRERYGATFTAYSEQLANTEWYNNQQILDYQNTKLKKLIRHVYETVPYYRSIFGQHNLKPDDISDITDLKKLPILTKELVKEHSSDLLSRARLPSTEKISYGGTSGTTGSPLKVAWGRDMRIFNNAIDWRQKRWGNIRPRDKMVMLLGRPIVSTNKKSPPFWQFDRFQNFLWMSAFHLNERNLLHYIKKIRSFGPKAIEGYPSTLYEISKYLINTGQSINLQAVFSSSEPLHEHYREAIETAFDCKVYDFYGLAERTIFATECEKHMGQHLNFEFGITEIVDEDLQEAKQGFMLTTSLENYAMPMIRYKVNDRTSIIEGPCPCGRMMSRIEQITTKQEDMIFKRDGTPISPSILTHPFKSVTTISKSQIIQTSGSKLLVKIVKTSDFLPKDEKRLSTELAKRVGHDMDLVFDYVDDIPKEPSGKYRWVINEVQK